MLYTYQNRINITSLYKNYSHTLCATDYKGPIVLIQPVKKGERDNDMYSISGNIINRQDHNGPNGIGIKQDEAYTLTATDKHGVCYPINDMVATSGGDTTPFGIGENGKHISTISTKHQHSVAYGYGGYANYKENKVSNLKNNGGDLGGGSETLITEDVTDIPVFPIDMDSNDIISLIQSQEQKLRLRKLTERECLKLMGMPADWFDGAEIAKGKRYEKCGNGLIGGTKDNPSYWYLMWERIYEFLGKNRPSLFSQFCGVGMTEYMTEQIGFNTAYTSEIDITANQVYNHNIKCGKLKHTINLGDITAINATELKPCDVVFASFPCQSVSIAGKNKGLIDEDTQELTSSGLVYHTLRTIKEMLKATAGNYPKVCAFENVAGLLTHKKDLLYILNELNDMGYDIDVQLHNSLNYNTPQSRERVSIVASKGYTNNINYEEYRHKRIRKVLGNDYPLISGLATFPHTPNKLNLIDFLDKDVPLDYDLSPKACVGILRRAYNRNKKLPEILAYALIWQAKDEFMVDIFKEQNGKCEAQPIRDYYAEMFKKKHKL